MGRGKSLIKRLLAVDLISPLGRKKKKKQQVQKRPEGQRARGGDPGKSSRKGAAWVFKGFSRE